MALLISIALVGCGEASSPAPATIALSSPAVEPDGHVAPHVRCGLGTLWLPVKWKAIPPDTEELLIYFGRFAHTEPRQSRTLALPFGVAFTKVNLNARGTEAGAYPPGSSPHYYKLNNCVPTPEGQKYFAAIFALDKPVYTPDPLNTAYAARITEEVLGIKDPATDSGPAETMLESTLAMGSFIATYGKPK